MNSESAAAIFQLNQVAKRLGGQPALQNIDLTIAAGQTTVLLGPSGCGKSTLLRLMTGLLSPDQGSVQFDGQPLTPDRLPDVRRRLGYVIQDGGLFPHLTARSNVTLMAEHLRRPADEVRSRVGELSELVRLSTDLLDRYPAELSGGQRQRVSLMRALMLAPDVLLLDEPLGALDPMTRFDLQNDLQAVFRQLSQTVVLVTHDLAEAAFFADRVVILRNGSIVQSGSVDDLVHRPADAFVEAFVRAQRPPPALAAGKPG